MSHHHLMLVTAGFLTAISLFCAATSAEEQLEDDAQIQLRYFHRSWASVLEDLAEQTEKTLVMPQPPRGRLHRLDRQLHTPEAAIRILNHELEDQGVRIIDRGQYLIVLEDEQFRPRYSARERKPSPSSETPVEQQMTHRERWQTIEQAAFQQETEQPSETPASSPQTGLAVSPKYLTATEIARRLFEIYGQNAELIEQGPLDLPAFAVQIPAGGQLPARTFTIGIDEQSNRLVIVAEKALGLQLVNVINRLDQSAINKNKQDQSEEIIIAPEQMDEQTTKQLNGILSKLQPSARQETQQPASEDPAFTSHQTMDGQENLSAILDRIRGDVSIEALNELGLLIFRGNEADIDSVMQIVQAIDSMSLGTTPEIHLRFLKEINCEALAELLNSVYESVQNIDQRANRQNRTIQLIPVTQPNAVIIVAPGVDLIAVNQLIDELDLPLPPQQQIDVFRLKYATAAEAVTVIEEFYEERPGLGTRLRLTADNRTNTLIVHADPRDLREIQLLISKLDAADSHAVSQVKLFPLKNAVAEELAEFLNQSISEALNPNLQGQTGGGQQQNNQVRSFVLEFLASDGTNQKLIRSGILSDIRISAEPRSNSLAVIAPERSLPLLAALIAALDQTADAEAEVKVFALTHADAATTLELLQELFEDNSTDSPVGVNLAGTEDAGSSLLPLRFSVDVRSNSILAVGGRDALTVVEAILLRLDQPAQKKRINQVIELRNVAVTEASEAINLFLESQRELSEIDPELVSSVELLHREVIVVPETLSNSLLISATPEYFVEIMRIIEQLDADPPQVVIQALLVEVELDNLDEFGVELGFQDSILFDRSIIDNLQTITNTTTNQNIQTTTQQIVSQEGAPGFLFNNPTLYPNLGNNTGPPAQANIVGGQGLSNFGVGRVSGDLGFGGLVLSASSESVSVLIRALAQQRNVQILSRPQIRTVDSQLAQIQVGQEVPIVNGVNITTAGIANPNIEYNEAGIILSVTPRVKPDGQIVMEVVAERSAYTGNGVPIFTDASTGNTITSPIKNISVARATVGVSDGQTIVLGGMITKSEDTLVRKVPWLGDIPVIGRAFRFDSQSNIRTELLIFLTPRIVHDDETNEIIKEVEAGRIHFFREEFEDIHGPIFGVPQADGSLMDDCPVPETEPHTIDPREPTPPKFEQAPLPLEQSKEMTELTPHTLVEPGQFKPVTESKSPEQQKSRWKVLPWSRNQSTEEKTGRVRLAR